MQVKENIRKPVISLIDESIKETNFLDCHLTLQLGYEGLTYSVLDTKRNKYLGVESYNFQNIFHYTDLSTEVSNIIKSNPLLQKKYKSQGVALVNLKSTLVPSPLFEKDKKDTFLKLNHTIEEDEIVQTDFLRNVEAYNIFAISKSIESTIKKYFDRVSFRHFSSCLIESILKQNKNQTDKNVFVHVQSSHFEIIVCEGKKLIFYNSFAHQTSEDFIYYLLFTCEQLKLNPETLNLILIGEVEKNSALNSILKKYIRNIKFGERPESFEYSYKLDQIPKHFYYNLFNQFLCE